MNFFAVLTDCNKCKKRKQEKRINKSSHQTHDDELEKRLIKILARSNSNHHLDAVALACPFKKCSKDKKSTKTPAEKRKITANWKACIVGIVFKRPLALIKLVSLQTGIFFPKAIL